MKKKLDTRFPAARIKKIMQTDEDVGKIAMAVPLLISKALELFLQDLCDRSYEFTRIRGAKTLSSSHLKQCIHSLNVFDFLKDTVSKVPDLDCSDAVSDDQLVKKKRTLADYEDTHGPESCRTKMVAAGRGRGRGRGNRAMGSDRFEDDPDMKDFETLRPEEKNAQFLDFRASTANANNTEKPVRNFDLNLDLDENGNVASVSDEGSSGTTEEFATETVHDKRGPHWFGEMENMAIDPTLLSCFNGQTEDDENYDSEE